LPFGQKEDKHLRLTKTLWEIFQILLGWTILLATFNTKWEKVGESGRKWEPFSYFCLYDKPALAESNLCLTVNMK
jgi:hypothetical protein